MGKQPHLLVEEGDVHDVALLPGDPGRVDRIAGHCDEAETVAENREYKVVDAVYEGRELTAASSSTAMAADGEPMPVEQTVSSVPS